ncbi:MAG: helix-turn-helix domain-containing protein [Bacteroidetes bacterium]|nr:helix-turn-helix domain-containing protein [Bacteroidota bacterium]MBS1672139.1 helix-turn-helix domain-containing protein [Bacteroidota bacterium]
MLHRIAEAIKEEGFTQAEVANHLKIEPQNFSRMLKNDDVKFSIMQSVAKFLKIDITHLIKGYKQKSIKTENSILPLKADKISLSKIPKIITVDNDGNDNILYVPIKARAGYLVGYGDPDFIHTLQSFRLPGLRNRTYRMFEADGPSMHPTIKDKDKVVASACENLLSVRDNRVHVIVTTNGVVIKRVLNRITERGLFYLKSDTIQHRQEYPTMELHPEDVIEIWHCEFKMSADFSEPTEFYKRISDMEIDILELKKLVKK